MMQVLTTNEQYWRGEFTSKEHVTSHVSAKSGTQERPRSIALVDRTCYRTITLLVHRSKKVTREMCGGMNAGYVDMRYIDVRWILNELWTGKVRKITLWCDSLTRVRPWEALLKYGANSNVSQSFKMTKLLCIILLLSTIILYFSYADNFQRMLYSCWHWESVLWYILW